MGIDVKSLHPLEVKVLRHVNLGEEITTDRIVSELDYKIGQCNQSFSWLVGRGCLQETKRVQKVIYEITDTGRIQSQIGTPGERIFFLLKELGSFTLPEMVQRLELSQSEVGSAFGQLSKLGAAALDENKKAFAKSEKLPVDVALVGQLLKKASEKEDGCLLESELTDLEKQTISKVSKKRGASDSAFKTSEREDIYYELTELGSQTKEELLAANITGEELGEVTAAILANGTWKNASFRP